MNSFGVPCDLVEEFKRYDRLPPAIRHTYSTAPYDMKMPKGTDSASRVEIRLKKLRRRLSVQLYGEDYPELGELI